MRPQTLGTIREFNTQNFRVVVTAEEEYDVDLSWDETGEVAEKINNGDFLVFCAKAAVYGPDGSELASDYLGDCIYESLDAFMDHRECGKQNRKYEAKGESGRCGSYFADMIHQAITEARKAWIDRQKMATRILLHA